MTPSFESEWRGRFERFARAHEDEARISGWSEAGLRRRVRAFQEVLASTPLPAHAVALDLGCGGGTYVRLLAGLGHRAIGLDYSLPSLGRARAADPGGKGRYLSGEAYALPFRAARFDLVTCIGVLQALASPEMALDEMRRVLRPGGVLVVEALNARAVPARAQEARERRRGLPAKVRAYDPDRVDSWLGHRGLVSARRLPIWLPPRQLPWVGTLLDTPWVRGALGRGDLARIGAHSFFFVARRSEGIA
ncbi:MAG: class I SAM-dependent methyltransferase [Candidatus Rokubacteria bacterium]|nr:class I SAM-dependent methyltransferase [Candidatus Rokubacteria bacterium]